MATIINTVSAPAGRGKTTKYAEPRIKQGGVIFVTPHHRLLDEMESRVEIKDGNWFRRATQPLHVIDSRQEGLPVGVRVASFLNPEEDTQDMTAVTRMLHSMQSLGITWEAFRDLSPDDVRGREVVIDGTPPCITTVHLRPATWDFLVRGGWITAAAGDVEADGLNVPVEVGMTVTLTVAGRKQATPLTYDGSLDRELAKVLSFIDAAPTKIMNKQGGHFYALQELDPELFRAAGKVTIMSASLNTGYFKEYSKRHGFKLEEASHGLDDTPLRCPNVEIFYALDSTRPGSKHLIDKNLTALNRLSEQCLQPSRNGSLATQEPDSVLGFFNAGIDMKLPGSSAKLKPGTLGINKYQTCDRVIYLAATQAGPGELAAVQLHLGLPKRPSTTTRHYDAMYQGIMRSRLRVDPNAPVKILVLTKRDAEEMAKKLGAIIPVSQCLPKVKFE